MVLEKKVKKENLYKEYLRLINGIVCLTDTEKKIVAFLLQLNDLSDEVLSTENRKIVQKECKVTELNLNNHISNLKKKGVLKEQDGILVLNDMLVPDFINGDVLIIFRLKVDRV